MAFCGYGVKDTQRSDLLRILNGAVRSLPSAAALRSGHFGVVMCKDVRVTKSSFLRVYAPEVSGSSDPVPGFVRTYGLLSEAEGDSHWTVEWNGRRLVCPRNLRLRVLESTVAFANAFRGLGSGLIPEGAAQAADRELKAYQRSYPEQRSHILTSAWHVPVRWFAAFDAYEKEVYEGPQGPRLRFRTDIGKAQARVRRACEVLAQPALFPGPGEEANQG